MLRIYAQFFLVILLHFTSFGQKKGVIKDTTQAFPLGVGISFNSNNLHTGIRVCAEQLLQINKHNKWRHDSIYKTRYGIKFLDYNILYNYDKEFNSSIAVSIDYGMRRVKRKGKIKEWIIGAGITRTFIPYHTYNVNSDGSVKEVTVPGNTYGSLVSMVGLGRDYMFSAKKRPLKWHIRVGSTVLFPYGSFILPYLTIDAGIVYRINSKPLKLYKGYYTKNK